jgi:hypothetical protein
MILCEFCSGLVVSYLGLLSLLEESLLTSLLLGLLSSEVLGLRDLLDLLLVETGDVDLIGGSNDVSGVNSSQRNTVNLEGAGDEEDTLVEGLQENDALATEAASEEDEDSTGLEGLARSPRSDSLADLWFQLLAGWHSVMLKIAQAVAIWKGSVVVNRYFVAHFADLCVRYIWHWNSKSFVV